MTARTLIVTTSYPAYEGDPAGHFVATEAKLLAETQRVTVVAPRVPCSVRSNQEVIGIPDAGLFGFPGALANLSHKPWLAWNALQFVQRARRVLSDLPHFDRVVAHWVLPCAWPISILRARLDNCAFEVVAHGSDVRLLQKLPRTLRHHILNQLLDAGATFRCVSQDLAETLLRHGPRALQDRIRISASPIDVQSTAGHHEARSRLGIEESEKLAVVVGRLIESKRTDVAIRAGILAGARVLVVGDGPERARLQREFRTVEFVGQKPRNQTLEFIAAADILLNASRSEGAPTVIREARALGTPVAATRVSDLATWAERDDRLCVVD